MKRAASTLFARLASCVMAALALPGPTAIAQEGTPTPRAADSSPRDAVPPVKQPKPGDAARTKSQSLQRQSLEALLAHDYPRSEAALRDALALEPASFVIHYNLACLHAAQGDNPGALDFLERSVELGFCDISQLRRDPMLRPLRDEDRFTRLLNGWDKVLDARLEADLTQAKQTFRGNYSVTKDARLRLAYLSAFEPKAFEEAVGELSRLADWAQSAVMPGVLDPGDMKHDAWVVVVLPTRPDFNRWAVAMFGPGVSSGLSTVGGSYEHDLKRLIAQDLGPTLRHEFFHVLHWRSCTRLGQTHPAWIQEGLCSLVEDYDMLPDAQGKPALVPAVSWRTNTVKRMEKSRLVLPIGELASRTHEQFQGTRRMALYAQGRAVFLYIYQRGRLLDWYKHYTAHFAEDPTGVASIEGVFNQTRAEFDKDFRAWLRTLPEAAEEIRTGMASLGIEVDAGKGEGPTVTACPRRDVPLVPGDIVTAIDNRPTRDLPELLRVLGTYKPGTEVTLSFRRGARHQSARVALVAAK